MSYILDALKKSEAERSRGAVPTLLTPPQTPFRSSIIGWVVIIALIVNACLFAAWLYWPRNASTPVVVLPKAVPSTAPTAESSNVPAVVAVPVAPPSVKPTRPAAPEPSFETPVTEPIAAPRSTARTPDLAVQSDTGTADVAFSTHVYASDPSMRAVTMNGKRFVEGDTIRPGIRIQEITETGVILEVNGRPIPVDVLQDWR